MVNKAELVHFIHGYKFEFLMNFLPVYWGYYFKIYPGIKGIMVKFSHQTFGL